MRASPHAWALNTAVKAHTSGAGGGVSAVDVARHSTTNLCWLEPFNYQDTTSPSTAWPFPSTGWTYCACYWGICSQALRDFRNQSHCKPRDHYPPDSCLTITPCPWHLLPLLWSQLQSPFAGRPCAYCGDTDTSEDRGEEPHLWPSRLSSPTPHHT